MIDILVYLFANYHDFNARPKTKTLKRKLSAVGFKDEAISAALRWLDGLKAAAIVDLPNGHRALRVYLAREQQKLGHEGLGFIAFLEAADLITPALRELVIEPTCQVQDYRFDGPLESPTRPRATGRRGIARRRQLSTTALTTSQATVQFRRP